MILYSVHENNKKTFLQYFYFTPTSSARPWRGTTTAGWLTLQSRRVENTPELHSTIHYPLSTWVALHYPVLFHSHSFNLAKKGIEQRVTQSYQHNCHQKKEEKKHKCHLTGSDAKSKSKFQHPASPGKSLKYIIVVSYFIIIKLEYDHWQPLSVTDWLRPV